MFCRARSLVEQDLRVGEILALSNVAFRATLIAFLTIFGNSANTVNKLSRGALCQFVVEERKGFV